MIKIFKFSTYFFYLASINGKEKSSQELCQVSLLLLALTITDIHEHKSCQDSSFYCS